MRDLIVKAFSLPLFLLSSLSAVNLDFESSASGSAAFEPTNWTVPTDRPNDITSAQGGFAALASVSSETLELVDALELTEPRDISFDFKIAVSEGESAGLAFFVNGQLYGLWTESSTWAVATFRLPAGSHSLSWRFARSGGALSRAWIDDIVLGTVAVPAPEAQAIGFGALRSEILSAIGEPQGAALTQERLDSLFSLTATDREGIYQSLGVSLVLDGLSGASNLTFLDLSGNGLTDVSEVYAPAGGLPTLSKLRFAIFNDNPVNDVAGINSLLATPIEALYFQDTNDDGTPSPFSGQSLSDLRTLAEAGIDVKFAGDDGLTPFDLRVGAVSAPTIGLRPGETFEASVAVSNAGALPPTSDLTYSVQVFLSRDFEIDASDFVLVPSTLLFASDLVLNGSVDLNNLADDLTIPESIPFSGTWSLIVVFSPSDPALDASLSNNTGSASLQVFFEDPAARKPAIVGGNSRDGVPLIGLEEDFSSQLSVAVQNRGEAAVVSDLLVEVYWSENDQFDAGQDQLIASRIIISPNLAPFASTTITFDGQPVSLVGVPLGASHLISIVSFAGAGRDEDPENNIAAQEIFVSGLDLELSRPRTIRPSNGVLSLGSTFDYSFTLANLGQRNFDDSQVVSFFTYLSNDLTLDQNDDLIDFELNLGGFELLPNRGNEFIVQRNDVLLDVPLPTGNYILITEVYLASGEPEDSLANNIAGLSVALSNFDLIPVSVSGAGLQLSGGDPSALGIASDREFSVSFKLRNIGSGSYNTFSTGPVEYRVYLSEDGVVSQFSDTLLDSGFLDYAGVLRSLTDSPTQVISGLTIPEAVNPGEYQLIVEILTGSPTLENSIENNTIARSVTATGYDVAVDQVVAVDLTDPDFILGRTAFAIGSDHDFGAEVVNRGALEVPAGLLSIRYFLSRDALLDDQDTLIATAENLDALPSGQTAPIEPVGFQDTTGREVSFSSEIEPGAYFLIALASIGDSNRLDNDIANNVRGATIFLSNFDLAPSSIGLRTLTGDRLDPTKLERGKPSNLRFDLANSGLNSFSTASAGPLTYEIWLSQGNDIIEPGVDQFIRSYRDQTLIGELLSGEEIRIDPLKFELPDFVPPGSYRLLVRVVPERSQEEDQLSNNVASLAVQVVTSLDLVMDAVSGGLERVAAGGELSDVRATIRSDVQTPFVQGDERTLFFEAWLSEDGVFNQDEDEPLQFVASKESTRLSFDQFADVTTSSSSRELGALQIPDSALPGNYTVFVAVGARGVSPSEVDLSDNLKSFNVEISNFDLAIALDIKNPVRDSQGRPFLTNGGAFGVEVTIANDGLRTFESEADNTFDIELRLAPVGGGDPQTLSSSDTSLTGIQREIRPGSPVKIAFDNIQVPATNLEPGVYELTASVLPVLEASEDSDENNSTEPIRVVVQGYDISLSQFEVEGHDAGELIYVKDEPSGALRVRVQNIGEAVFPAIQPLTLQLFLGRSESPRSTDEVENSAVELSSAQLQALAGGEPVTVTFDSIPVELGEGELGDAFFTIRIKEQLAQDSISTNNSIQRSLLIGNVDPSVASVTIEGQNRPFVLVRGESYDVSVKLRNLGAVPFDAVEVEGGVALTPTVELFISASAEISNGDRVRSFAIPRELLPIESGGELTVVLGDVTIQQNLGLLDGEGRAIAYNLFAEVKLPEGILEESQANNTNEASPTVFTLSGPDPAITGLNTKDDPRFAPFGNLSDNPVTVNVRNTGLEAIVEASGSQNLRVELFLSNDNQLSDDDSLIDSISLLEALEAAGEIEAGSPGSLQPDEVISFVFDDPAATVSPVDDRTVGQKFLFARLASTFQENSTTNNSRSIQVAIQGPDPSVRFGKRPPVSISRNQSLALGSFEVVVANQALVGFDPAGFSAQLFLTDRLFELSANGLVPAQADDENRFLLSEVSGIDQVTDNLVFGESGIPIPADASLGDNFLIVVLKGLVENQTDVNFANNIASATITIDGPNPALTALTPINALASSAPENGIYDFAFQGSLDLNTTVANIGEEDLTESIDVELLFNGVNKRVLTLDPPIPFDPADGQNSRSLSFRGVSLADGTIEIFGENGQLQTFDLTARLAAVSEQTRTDDDSRTVQVRLRSYNIGFIPVNGSPFVFPERVGLNTRVAADLNLRNLGPVDFTGSVGVTGELQSVNDPADVVELSLSGTEGFDSIVIGDPLNRSFTATISDVQPGAYLFNVNLAPEDGIRGDQDEDPLNNSGARAVTVVGPDLEFDTSSLDAISGSSYSLSAALSAPLVIEDVAPGIFNRDLGTVPGDRAVLVEAYLLPATITVASTAELHQAYQPVASYVLRGDSVSDPIASPLVPAGPDSQLSGLEINYDWDQSLSQRERTGVPATGIALRHTEASGLLLPTDSGGTPLFPGQYILHLVVNPNKVFEFEGEEYLPIVEGSSLSQDDPARLNNHKEVIIFFEDDARDPNLAMNFGQGSFDSGSWKRSDVDNGGFPTPPGLVSGESARVEFLVQGPVSNLGFDFLFRDSQEGVLSVDVLHAGSNTVLGSIADLTTVSGFLEDEFVSANLPDVMTGGDLYLIRFTFEKTGTNALSDVIVDYSPVPAPTRTLEENGNEPQLELGAWTVDPLSGRGQYRVTATDANPEPILTYSLTGPATISTPVEVSNGRLEVSLDGDTISFSEDSAFVRVIPEGQRVTLSYQLFRNQGVSNASASVNIDVETRLNLDNWAPDYRRVYASPSFLSDGESAALQHFFQWLGDDSDRVFAVRQRDLTSGTLSFELRNAAGDPIFLIPDLNPGVEDKFVSFEIPQALDGGVQLVPGELYTAEFLFEKEGDELGVDVLVDFIPPSPVARDFSSFQPRIARDGFVFDPSSREFVSSSSGDSLEFTVAGPYAFRMPIAFDLLANDTGLEVEFFDVDGDAPNDVSSRVLIDTDTFLQEGVYTQNVPQGVHKFILRNLANSEVRVGLEIPTEFNRGGWVISGDPLASDGTAFQTRVAREGEELRMKYVVEGPTIVNAPWLINGVSEALSDTGVPDSLSVEVFKGVGVTGERKVVGENDTETRSISGLQPVYTDARLLIEPGLHTVVYTYRQENSSASSFARVDLDLPDFSSVLGDEGFLLADDFGQHRLPADVESPTGFPLSPPNDLRAGRNLVLGAPLLGVDETARLDVTVTGPGYLYFDLYMDRQADEILTFRVNGETPFLPTVTFEEEPLRAEFVDTFGNTGLAEWRSLRFLLPAGENNLSWVVENRGSEPVDTELFLDNVRFFSLDVFDSSIPRDLVAGRGGVAPISDADLNQWEPTTGTLYGDSRDQDHPLKPEFVLRDDRLTVSPGLYVVGGESVSGRIPFSLTITNSGADFEDDPQSFSGDLEVWLSLDASIDPDEDVSLSEFVELRESPSEQVILFSGSLPIPTSTAAGTYNLIIRFSPYDLDSEPNERFREHTLGNNTLVRDGFILERRPDLRIATDRFPRPTYPYYPLGRVPFSFFVGNTGQGGVSVDEDIRVNVRLGRESFRGIQNEPFIQLDSFVLNVDLPEPGAFNPPSSRNADSRRPSQGNWVPVTAMVSLPTEQAIRNTAQFGIGNARIENDRFYLSVVVDAGNGVLETNEANNTLAIVYEENQSSRYSPLADDFRTDSGFFYISTTSLGSEGKMNWARWALEPAFGAGLEPYDPSSSSLFSTDGDSEAVQDGFVNLFEYAFGTAPFRNTDAYFESPLISGVLVDSSPDESNIYQVGIRKILIPPFNEPKPFLTSTFNFNVRAEDISGVLYAGNDLPLVDPDTGLPVIDPVTSLPRADIETVIELNPPYFGVDVEQALSGYRGLDGEPVVLGLIGGDLDSVARFTVRDVRPIGSIADDGVPNRFLQFAVKINDNIPSIEAVGPVLNFAGEFDFLVNAVRLSWQIPAELVPDRDKVSFWIRASYDSLDQTAQNIILEENITDLGGGFYEAFDTFLPLRPGLKNYRIRMVNITGVSDAANLEVPIPALD